MYLMVNQDTISGLKGNTEAFHDPVCGLNLSGFADLALGEWQGKSVSFCGEGCKARFFNTPAKFQGEPLIKLRGVYKSFRLGIVDVEVLRGLDINIWEGDFVSIVGASGSGKSTVLNLIGLLDLPTSGTIFFKGKDVSKFSDDERALFRTKTFGFVFQQYNLIPWLTAYENATLPLIFSGAEESLFENVRKTFQEVGLKDRMVHRPFELSGGEQQRTALIRALANNPLVVLGDEPTGNLDSTTGQKILDMLVDLSRAQNKTLVIVTHDSSIAEMADEIIGIKDGQMIRDHHMHKKVYAKPAL